MGENFAGSGISVDIWTSYGASIMVVSTIPFIVVQIPQVFHLSSDGNLAVLVSFIVAVGLLVSYCVYQVLVLFIFYFAVMCFFQAYN